MDNNDGRRRVPIGTFGDPDADPDPNRDRSGEPPTQPLRPYPRTLHGRPGEVEPAASADASPEAVDRPSVQSIPPPTPVGDPPPEELIQRVVRSRAVTPDYARLSERRGAIHKSDPTPPAPEANSGEVTPMAVRKSEDLGSPLAQDGVAQDGVAQASVENEIVVESEIVVSPAVDDQASHAAPEAIDPAASDEAVAPATAAPLNPTPPSAARARARQRTPWVRMDTQAWWGLALLGAMTVIGFGGWLWTRGTYVRRSPAPAPAAPQAPDSSPAATATPAGSAVPASGAALAGSAAVKTAGAVPANRKKAADVLPDKPSREDVRAVLTPLRDALGDCAHGKTGVAQLDITIANSGAVTLVVVGGDFAGTREGSCIARVARTARFVRFKRPRFRVIFPFSL
jgi:hypothetical protein